MTIRTRVECARANITEIRACMGQTTKIDPDTERAVRAFIVKVAGQYDLAGVILEFGEACDFIGCLKRLQERGKRCF